MNYKKANVEVLKSVLDSNSVRGFWMDEKRFAVAPDGYHAYVFEKGEIAFDVSKVKPIDDFIRAETIVKGENKLQQTPFYLKKYGKMLAVFDGKNGKVYIDKRYLAMFNECDFYQNDQNGTVLATQVGMVVGAVLPFRIDEGKF